MILPFVPVSWTCKETGRQCHSNSTDAEVISLGRWPEKGRITCITLRDIANDVLELLASRARSALFAPTQTRGHTKPHRNPLTTFHQSHPSPSCRAHVFFQSGTMKRVMFSRAHRVKIGFERISLNSNIPVKTCTRPNRSQDILTKGSFTLDRWNEWMYLLGIPGIG